MMHACAAAALYIPQRNQVARRSGVLKQLPSAKAFQSTSPWLRTSAPSAAHMPTKDGLPVLINMEPGDQVYAVPQGARMKPPQNAFVITQS